MLQKTQCIQKDVTPRKVFISYAHEDEPLKNLLLLLLRPLETEGLIRAWHDRLMLAGVNLFETIRSHLESSDLVLLLVTESFLESRFCRFETTTALRRHEENKAHVIPVILKECDFLQEPFAALLALPIDAKPIFSTDHVPDVERITQTLEGLRFALLGLWSATERPLPGATMKGGSSVCAHPEHIDALPALELLQPSAPFTPLLMKGARLMPDSNELAFQFDSGSRPAGPEFHEESQRLIRFFKEGLAAPLEDQWVDLSPDRSHAMLGPSLSGTSMGRELLAFDCLLKQFAASLLHPDCPTGRAYWKELNARARAQLGTSLLPYEFAHTITIVPEEIVIYQHSRADPAALPQGEGFFYEGHLHAAFLSKQTQSVKCTMSASGGPEPDRRVSTRELTMAVFRDVALPLILREINEGAHFATCRQIYSTIALGCWFRRILQADSSLQARFGDCVDRACSKSSAWLPEEQAIYDKYLELYNSGLYRIVRTEPGDEPATQIARVYFSGAIDFRSSSQALAIETLSSPGARHFTL